MEVDHFDHSDNSSVKIIDRSRLSDVSFKYKNWKRTIDIVKILRVCRETYKGH